MARLYYSSCATVLCAAAVIALPLVALAQTEFPAIVRTTIPTGAADGGLITYEISLGGGQSLQLRVDAGNLIVAVSGQAQSEFALYRVFAGEYIPLECSRGFLGVLTGTVSCGGVESGAQLVFVRKDVVDQVLPLLQLGGGAEDDSFVSDGDGDGTGAGDVTGGEDFGGGGDVFDGGDFGDFGGNDLSIGGDGGLFEDNLFTTFGDYGGEDATTDGGEFAFGEEDLGTFADGGEVAPEEPSFLESVADFFGLGGDEVVETPVDEFAFESEGAVQPEEVFVGEKFALEDAGAGAAVGFGDEGVAVSEAQPGIFRRVWQKVAEFFSRIGSWVSNLFGGDTIESAADVSPDEGTPPDFREGNIPQ